MSGILFETESEIDIRSFTVFGLSSKPKTNSPIGFFGTGLKYAVAVCCRLGIPFRLWIGETQYEFYAKDKKFRDKDYSQIRMRRRGLLARWTYEELPFTTDYGKNWKLWQVLRELEANTRDEGGKSMISESEVGGVRGLTRILIESDEFVELWRSRDDIFLDRGEPVDESPYARIYPGETKHLYWRGMRVYTLPGKDKFMNTYDLKEHLQLTEDRTILYSSLITWYIAKAIVACGDEDVIQLAIEEHDEDSIWIERSLDFPDNQAPGPTFKRVADRLAQRSRISMGARSYGGRWLGSTGSTGLGDSRTNDQRFMDNLVHAYRERDHEDLADLMFSAGHASLVEDMIEQARKRAYGQTT